MLDDEIDRRRRPAPRQLRARRPKHDGQALPRRPGQNRRQRVGGRGLDDDARLDTVDGVGIGSRPRAGMADEIAIFQDRLRGNH